MKSHPAIEFNYDYLMSLSSDHFNYITTHHLNKVSMVTLSFLSPIQFIKDNPQLDWDWSLIGVNTNLTDKFLYESDGKFTTSIAMNPSFRISGLIKLFGKDEAISMNPNLRVQDLIKHKNIEWIIGNLLSNPYIMDDRVCDARMSMEVTRKQRSIIKNSGMLSDLVGVVAEYCWIP
jgi:hypothetical protein